jgi:hypothetical protein
MSPVFQQLTAKEHLASPAATPEFQIPKRERKLQNNRPKAYRLILNSKDRVDGTPTEALFDLGDLKGAWLLGQNLDVGTRHFQAKIDTFFVTSDVAQPAVVEIRGVNWPHQSESFDSSTQGPTNLLGIAAGGATVYLDAHDTYFTLRELPSGRVGIRLIARESNAAQIALDADATVTWSMVLSISPSIE